MAELETTGSGASSCCSPAAQESCCEPEAKDACCGDRHADGCGCSAGEATEGSDLRALVRERYAAAAMAASGGADACCGDAAVIAEQQRHAFGDRLYERGDRDAVPHAARLASLGCGNPTAVADLHEGETVLDLGSGGGARRPALGPPGRARAARRTVST